MIFRKHNSNGWMTYLLTSHLETIRYDPNPIWGSARYNLGRIFDYRQKWRMRIAI